MPHPPYHFYAMKHVTPLLALLVVFALAPVQAQRLTAEETPSPELLAAPDILPTGRTCAVPEPTPAEARAVQQEVARWLASQPDAPSLRGASIPVAFHVVYRKSNGEGNVATSALDAQINVLNAAYGGTGYSFYRYSVDRYGSSGSWFTATNGTSAERQMKQSLATDPRNLLNFYTNKPSGGTLGWATFPWMYAESDYRHGVVVNYGTLPGGYLSPYNQGDTGTHEVGHYLGLYHTFQGGCSESGGDYVSDTPAEASPAYGCPVGRNSCSTGGSDPIRNFMDYTDDACMFEFTGGQSSRMNTYTSYYRPGLGFFQTPPPSFARAEPAAKSEAYPNPFVQSSTIRFTLMAEADVTVRVYDVLGRAVATLVDGRLEAGTHAAVFEADALPSGTYAYRVEIGDAVTTGRMQLVR